MDRVLKEIESVSREIERRDCLAEMFARYSNRLRVECDGDDWEEVEFLKEVTRYLECMIIGRYMRDNGYFRDGRDTFDRWSRE